MRSSNHNVQIIILECQSRAKFQDGGTSETQSALWDLLNAHGCRAWEQKGVFWCPRFLRLPRSVRSGKEKAENG